MTIEAALSAALLWLRRGDAERALAELEYLVAREPSSAKAHNALGSVLGSLGRQDEALLAFEKALSLQPNYPEASTNLGSALLEGGLIAAASTAFETAIGSGKAPAQAHLGLGRAACLLGRFRDAREALDRAAAHPRAGATIHSQRCYASLLDPDADAPRVVAVHREYEARVAAALRSTAPSTNDPNPDRRLVLGYVSADFREHSVACFLEGILAAHDRDRFEVVAYSDTAREDETTQRLRSLVDHFRPIRGLGDEDLVVSIKKAGVDVLIDLAGHMQPNRLGVFARRPAPVCFTYLGYPGSTGMAAFDGRVTDAWADPVTDPCSCGPEPLIQVDQGYFAYLPPADAPDTSPPPATVTSRITFGSMNDILKVNDRVLSTWAEILARVPGSRLFLKARMLSSQDVCDRVLRVLAAANVDASRVELVPATASRREHLALYSRIDLALDTFPYSGATTTCEALYMGVPVLTLVGDRHAGRLSTSILRAVGLDRLVTRERAAYVDLAVRMAEDLAGLSQLRQKLRDRVRTSPLCDGARVARAIEGAATPAFRRWSDSARGRPLDRA